MTGNVEVVRDLYEAFSRSDLDTVRAAPHSKIVWLEAEGFLYADGNHGGSPSARRRPASRASGKLLAARSPGAVGQPLIGTDRCLNRGSHNRRPRPPPAGIAKEQPAKGKHHNQGALSDLVATKMVAKRPTCRGCSGVLVSVLGIARVRPRLALYFGPEDAALKGSGHGRRAVVDA